MIKNIISKPKGPFSLKKLAGFTEDKIIGKSNNLKQVIQNNLEVISKGYGFKNREVEILQVELKNKSVAPINLYYIGEYTFHTEYKYIYLEPRSSKTIYVKTKKIKEKVDLEFEVLNYVIAPKTNLKTIKTVTIE